MVNDNKLKQKTIWLPLPLLFPVHQGLPAAEPLPLCPLAFGYKSKDLVPSQAPKLEDSSHNLSSPPLSRHGLCSYVLGHGFAALAQIPIALGHISCSSCRTESVRAVCVVTWLLSVYKTWFLRDPCHIHYTNVNTWYVTSLCPYKVVEDQTFPLCQ